jgi:hypothetical protein
MSEFQEKVNMMKEGMSNAIEDNPALISSDLVNDHNEELSIDPTPEENQRPRLSSNQRNEKGRRTKKNLQDRLDAVIADNRAKEAQQQQLMAYLQDQERRLAEAQAKAEQNAHYSNVYYEQGLDNEEQRVLTELEFAKENSDIKKEIVMQQRLAEIAAQKQTQLLSKTLQKQQPAPVIYQEPSAQYPLQEYQQQVMQQEPVNENLEDFLEENPWADPRSPEYDQHLKLKGGSYIIGTPEYYNSIREEMYRRYDTNGNSDNNYDDYPDNRAYEVAPVTKRGSSMADRYVSNYQNPNGSTGQRMSLTKDEYQVAVKLAPTLSSIYGRPFTEKEAVAEYYKQKMESMPRRNAY